MGDVPECCRDGCRTEYFRDYAEQYSPGERIGSYSSNQLNFSISQQKDDDDLYLKPKLARDSMSHRIIEKRRRDRMNNCLADLSRLIPAEYLKKGRGRVEKTEIIEMAIKYMKHLQNVITNTGANPGDLEKSYRQPIVKEHYNLGYLECLSETMHFLVEIKGFYSRDPLCLQLMSHLHKHSESILKGDVINFPRIEPTTSTSSNSSSTGNSPPLRNNSDYTHSEYAACSSESEEQTYMPTAASGTKAKEETGSQLRDMLTNQKKKQTESSGFETGSSTEEHSMYKFKNTIKQRYTESQKHDEEELSQAKKLKFETTEGVQPQQLLTQRLSFGHKGPQFSTYEEQSKEPSKFQPPNIPIFALHTSGSYYIPMTLDQHILSPHLPALYDERKVVLHPVTISVNFQPEYNKK